MSAASSAPDPAGFARHFSLEATRPGAAEIAALADILPRGTPLYLTAVPTQDGHELVTAAAGVRKAGLEPVAHIAARRIAGANLLQELLTRLRGEADMRRLLLIGGDVDTPGAFSDALAVLQRGGLREAGIEEIGIGAYPEGHPRIPTARLEASLDEKIASATAQGLRVNIVTQFSFSGERIIAWLKQLRSSGIKNRVGIGLAGPTSVPALIRYAKRCGVSTSLRGLASGMATSLVGNVGPERIIEMLSASQPELGETRLHYFSFGGVVQTARYACDLARTGAGQKAAANS